MMVSYLDACFDIYVRESSELTLVEFAFYVNKNGWRSKPRWAIIWEGVPTAFGEFLC